MVDRKLRMGMVGGDRASFIGSVHRIAAQLDGRIELVGGAFSWSPELSRQAGEAYHLDPRRVYGAYQEMIEAERNLPADARMDFITIVTPNHLHFHPAMLALQAGFHVVCEKPLATSVREARELIVSARESKRIVALTHPYTAYPMVKQAREWVREGRLGPIRKVVVEYTQGWLATALEHTGQPQAVWRTDPAQAGPSCCMGDIGVHAFNLAEYITDLNISSVCADLSTFVPGRALDDDGSVLLRFENGARGALLASQISVGEENALRIRVYGQQGGLEWAQQEPNSLWLRWLDRPMEVIRTGGPGAGPLAAHNTRLPAGHPEGFIEAFANLYRNFADTVLAEPRGEAAAPQDRDFPGLAEGLRGMQFIEAVVASSGSDRKWIEVA